MSITDLITAVYLIGFCASVVVSAASVELDDGAALMKLHARMLMAGSWPITRLISAWTQVTHAKKRTGKQ